mmetsp:Transcript_25299/g.74409  ORF Transcript_25299/g.74409 Transcript_25299/m.74409 type:complete len:213 (-) Transcript_25299:2011-2649(-)
MATSSEDKLSAWRDHAFVPATASSPPDIAAVQTESVFHHSDALSIMSSAYWFFLSKSFLIFCRALRRLRTSLVPLSSFFLISMLSSSSACSSPSLPFRYIVNFSLNISIVNSNACLSSSAFRFSSTSRLVRSSRSCSVRRTLSLCCSFSIFSRLIRCSFSRSCLACSSFCRLTSSNSAYIFDQPLPFAWSSSFSLSREASRFCLSSSKAASL